ncbi:MAG TPA: MFS transporter [Planctomycetota bacterium]
MTAVRDRLPLPTLAVLFVGYACCYFHRADLSTLAPLYAASPDGAAMARALPDIASLGVLVYALGKMAGGVLADRFGGRLLFVMALCGASIAEFAASRCESPGTFALCRVFGMAALSLAWPSVGQIVSSATPVARLGTAMVFVSQSYLLGDATVRALLAAVVDNGGGPAEVLHTSTLGLAVGALVVSVGLCCTRARGGEPRSLLTGDVRANAKLALRSMLRPMVWMALMNVALVFVRESLSLWTPALLVDLCQMPAASAVRASALLPLASAVGALVAGPLADRGSRALFWATFAPALFGALALLLVAAVGGDFGPWFVIAALAATSVGFAMPMTLASGVLPLRAGAGRSATMLGFVDGTGSLGAVLAGGGLARVLAAFGTSGAFLALGATALCAALFAAASSRAVRRTPTAP